MRVVTAVSSFFAITAVTRASAFASMAPASRRIQVRIILVLVPVLYMCYTCIGTRTDTCITTRTMSTLCTSGICDTTVAKLLPACELSPSLQTNRHTHMRSCIPRTRTCPSPSAFNVALASTLDVAVMAKAHARATASQPRHHIYHLYTCIPV